VNSVPAASSSESAEEVGSRRGRRKRRVRNDLWSVLEGSSLGARRGADSVIVGMMGRVFDCEESCEDQLLKDKKSGTGISF
jgi:hypothetical protein